MHLTLLPQKRIILKYIISMKKNFFPQTVAFVMLAIFWSGSQAIAQTDAKVTTVIEWASKIHDFGKIPRGKPVTAEFQFTNPSLVPLIITSVRPSCGCTVADYPKEPVQPQKSGVIKVTYNAAGTGYFQKSVAVTTNAGDETEVLIIKGEVLAENEQSQPAAEITK
jgi:hypothetical protein